MTCPRVDLGAARRVLAFVSNKPGMDLGESELNYVVGLVTSLTHPAAIIDVFSVQSELFGDVVDLTGGIASSMVGMVLPGLIYLEATRGIHNRSGVMWYRRGCYVLVTLGILTVITVPTGVLLNALGYE